MLILEFIIHNHQHTLTFESQDKSTQFHFQLHTFYTKIVFVLIDSSSSHQLDPANVSSIV